MLRIVIILFALACLVTPSAADWSIEYRGSVDLNKTGFSTVNELSGVTYVAGGPNLAEFIAIQDDDGWLSRFTATFDSSGLIQTADVYSTLRLSNRTLDMEGVAYSNGDLFVAYERNEASATAIPGVRKYNTSNGLMLSNLTLPSVWTTPGNVRSNRGFESLVATPGGMLWTANEEALTIDGGRSGEGTGTWVRLQQLDPSSPFGAGLAQFAYHVDPPHGANPDRSGLSDLVVLPNGELLALERSSSISFPVFESRMFTVDHSIATDVSSVLFDVGLAGQLYEPVSKNLVWSGQVAIPAGSNLEGLSLGPRLDNGNWVLLGVVDNSAALNGNYIASWELSWTASGDFDANGSFGCADIDSLVSEIVAGSNNPDFDLTGDGVVDGHDQTEWLIQAGAARGLGPILAGDANLDGAVDVSDFNLWNGNKFSSANGWCGADFNHDGTTDVSDFNVWNTNKFQSSDALPVPEPCGWGLLMTVVMVGLANRNRKVRA